MSIYQTFFLHYFYNFDTHWCLHSSVLAMSICSNHKLVLLFIYAVFLLLIRNE